MGAVCAAAPDFSKQESASYGVLPDQNVSINVVARMMAERPLTQPSPGGGEGGVSPGEGDDGHSFSRIALTAGTTGAKPVRPDRISAKAR